LATPKPAGFVERTPWQVRSLWVKVRLPKKVGVRSPSFKAMTTLPVRRRFTPSS
jgi:hypothetical protein